MDAFYLSFDLASVVVMAIVVVSGLGWLCLWSPHGMRWRQAKRLVRGEDGAAYTLSYVMVVPIYAWLICLIAESVMFMTAKLGTNYAAFAGARSASVWASATPWPKAQEKIRQAATQAFIPFASGTQPVSPLDAGRIATILGNRRAIAFQTAYQEFGSNTASIKYVTKKFVHAQLALDVKTKGPPAEWNSEIEVTVSYKYPFQVPGIGRLLGKRGLNNRYYYNMATTVRLPNEGPRNKTQTLGIGYGTF